MGKEEVIAVSGVDSNLPLVLSSLRERVAAYSILGVTDCWPQVRLTQRHVQLDQHNVKNELVFNVFKFQDFEIKMKVSVSPEKF